MSGRLRLRAFAWGFVLWAVVALVTARGYMLLSSAGGAAVSLSQALMQSLPQWAACALLTVPVLELVAALPIRSPRIRERLSLHLVAALVFVGLHLVLTVQIARWIGTYSSTDPFLAQLAAVARVFVAYDFLIYICLAGICHAILAHEAYRDQALRSARQSVSLARARYQGMVLKLQPESLLPLLSAIAERIRTDSVSARRMISRLGELLRWSLEDGDMPRLIPLSRELMFLDLYLDILRELHRGPLNVRFDVELDMYDVLVPPFLLQPLTQLAAGDLSCAGKEGAQLEVRAWRDGTVARLSVEAPAGTSLAGDLPSLVGSLEATASALCDQLREIYAAPVSARARAVADRISIQLELPVANPQKRSVA